MFANFPTYFSAAAITALSMITPAWSATVTILPGAPSAGTNIDLSVGDFERLGNCGGGGSVVNDGCSVVIKADPSASHAYGRFDPPPANYWIDSQDVDELKWTVTSPVAFTSMTFALTDAHDQANSHFVMSFNDGAVWTSIWDIPTMLPNGNLFWLVVDFGEKVTSAEFRFSTKVGAGYDGYGLSQLSVSPSPVPAPPAALLMLSGAAVLAGVRFRRKAR